MDLGHGNRWRLDACPACPAQTLPLGRFDVSERPDPATRYDPTAGHRINTITGLPECVHPHRIQLPTGRYASNGEPAPGPAQHQPQDPARQPPDEVGELEAWFTATLRQAPVESIAAALADAEAAAKRRLPAHDVTAAMRRALSPEQSSELTRGILIRQRLLHDARQQVQRGDDAPI